jgi:hypothetical protein
MRKYWKGDAAGHVGDWDWDDAASAYAASNWVDESGTGLAKPAAGDIAMFGSGSQDVTAGLDQAATGAFVIKVMPGYTGVIGAAGTPLLLGGAAVEVTGGDGAYIDGDDITVVIVAPTKGVVVSLAGTNHTVTALRGTISLNGDGSINAEIGKIDNDTDCAVTIGDGYTSGMISQWGGWVTRGADGADYAIQAGLCKQASGAAPTLFLYGGKYQYYSTSASGTLTLKAYSGSFDATESVGTFAVDSTSVIFGNPSVNLANGSGGITGSLTCYGKVPTVDPGTVLRLNA